MDMKLVKERRGALYSKDVRVENDPDRLKGLLNSQRWEMLKLIADRPMYPAEIAKKLKMHEQKVYYHIRELEQSGIIKVINKVEMKGALAKFYAPSALGFVLDLPLGYERIDDSSFRNVPENVRDFLAPHVRGGKINTTVVVGSPDAHGPHQVRSRDGHYAVELGIFLGGLGRADGASSSFSVRLDVDIKAEKKYDGNLILVGGILTNIITADVNRHSPVRFLEDEFPYRRIYSENTTKTYPDENTGMISKIRNPFSPEKSIIIIAGNTNGGTKAAVLAFTRHMDEMLKGRGAHHSDDGSVFARIVRGFDMDGDGKIDTVKILE